MEKAIDKVSIAIASGLPRRDVLRQVLGGVVAAATASVSLRDKLAAAGPQSSAATIERAMKPIRKVRLDLELANGNRPQMKLPDRFPGTVSYEGRSLTVVPSIMEANGSVEVSIYQGDRDDMRLLHRVIAPLHERGEKATSVRLASVGLSNLPITGFAAAWAGQAVVDADYDADCDCTVKCCWGGSLTACGGDITECCGSAE